MNENLYFRNVSVQGKLTQSLRGNQMAMLYLTEVTICSHTKALFL
jgi:hypothetical protein